MAGESIQALQPEQNRWYNRYSRYKWDIRCDRNSVTCVMSIQPVSHGRDKLEKHHLYESTSNPIDGHELTVSDDTLKTSVTTGAQSNGVGDARNLERMATQGRIPDAGSGLFTDGRLIAKSPLLRCGDTGFRKSKASFRLDG